MECRILLTAEERFKAFSLIHDVYVNEQGWDIPKDNPSKLLSTIVNGVDILTDKFDVYATWFGVFDNNDLVACCRLIDRPVDTLEISHYNKLPKELSDLNAFEINRLAVKSQYRGQDVLSMMATVVFNYCKSKKIDLMVAGSTFPNPGILYIKKMGFERIKSSKFKYHHLDEQFAYTIYLDFRNEQFINKLIDKFSSNTMVYA